MKRARSDLDLVPPEARVRHLGLPDKRQRKGAVLQLILIYINRNGNRNL